MATRDRIKFIGIDGGGTKTFAVIGDETGRIEAAVTGKSSNIQSKSLRDVREVLIQLINRLMTETETKPEQLGTIFMSLAGCGRLEDQQEVYEAIRPYFSGKLIVENDAIGALAAGTWGEPGIVLIAGTGSIAYVFGPDNHLARVGGWGYLLGDEGSGYDIGRKGLTAVLKQFDGRGERTVLTDRLMEKFHLSHPAELVPRVYRSDDLRGEIADLARIVFRAAEEGDAVSAWIVDEAIHELIVLAETAAKHEYAEGLPLVINGGLFHNHFFKNQFTEEAQRRIKDLSVLSPGVPPAAGAFLLALNTAGISLDDKGKRNLKSSFASIQPKEGS